MVDVGAKPVTAREAVAVATIRMQPSTLRKLIEQALPKGDVLTTAPVAGSGPWPTCSARVAKPRSRSVGSGT